MSKILVNIGILREDRTWFETGNFEIDRDSIPNVEYGFNDGDILDAAIDEYRGTNGGAAIVGYAMLNWEDLYEDEEEGNE